MKGHNEVDVGIDRCVLGLGPHARTQDNTPSGAFPPTIGKRTESLAGIVLGFGWIVVACYGCPMCWTLPTGPNDLRLQLRLSRWCSRVRQAAVLVCENWFGKVELLYWLALFFVGATVVGKSRGAMPCYSNGAIGWGLEAHSEQWRLFLDAGKGCGLGWGGWKDFSHRCVVGNDDIRAWSSWKPSRGSFEFIPSSSQLLIPIMYYHDHFPSKPTPQVGTNYWKLKIADLDPSKSLRLGIFLWISCLGGQKKWGNCELCTPSDRFFALYAFQWYAKRFWFFCIG